MSQPVKLSDDLVLDARVVGRIVRRSIAAQLIGASGLPRSTRRRIHKTPDPRSVEAVKQAHEVALPAELLAELCHIRLELVLLPHPREEGTNPLDELERFSIGAARRADKVENLGLIDGKGALGVGRLPHLSEGEPLPSWTAVLARLCPRSFDVLLPQVEPYELRVVVRHGERGRPDPGDCVPRP